MSDTNTTTAAALEIKNAVVVYRLRIRKPGSSGKVSAADVRVRSAHVEDAEARDPEADALKISKVLIKHEKFRELVALDNGLRGYVRSQALPTRLAAGCYLLPVALVEKVDAHVAARALERAALVRELEELYPSLVEDARTRLGDLFVAADFPSVAAFVAAFDVTTSVEALADPGQSLAKFSAALYRRELAKAEKARVEMVSEIRDGMRVALRELVSGLVEQLQGKRVRLMAGAFEKVKTFIDEFQARNVARDGELEALVEKARAVVGAVPVETFKASTTARGEVSRGMSGVCEVLEKLTGDATAARASFLDLDGTAEVERAAPEREPIAPSARAGALELDGTEDAAPAASVAPDASTTARASAIELEDAAPSAELTPDATTTLRAGALDLD